MSEAVSGDISQLESLRTFASNLPDGAVKSGVEKTIAELESKVKGNSISTDATLVRISQAAVTYTSKHELMAVACFCMMLEQSVVCVQEDPNSIPGFASAMQELPASQFLPHKWKDNPEKGTYSFKFKRARGKPVLLKCVNMGNLLLVHGMEEDGEVFCFEYTISPEGGDGGGDGGGIDAEGILSRELPALRPLFIHNIVEPLFPNLNTQTGSGKIAVGATSSVASTAGGGDTAAATAAASAAATAAATEERERQRDARRETELERRERLERGDVGLRVPPVRDTRPPHPGQPLILPGSGGDFGGDIFPGGEGGGLMGPGHPGWFGGGAGVGGGGGFGEPPFYPPGPGVPPGARFDPFTPPGPGIVPGRGGGLNGRGRGRGGRGGRGPGTIYGPNPDELPPPGWSGGDDSYFG